ncbi:hypothetical protein C3747_54g247 [Trypanosoma cruzi]|uniref:Uncharacterized protein n=2 Tax=Trypanosoma cruzi TaxID=5693 RepID=Q4DV80_TRYCC|nr:hypothetical protein, conserved [Trypanosoma cruzi]EAN96414.1 hypothetical protein, conserved [Trypanosoma cruzi]PWV12019.1 hypothetical protein C3747_54g247 [Trypanosoma cruzi]RNC44694.1 hypothetical protein TcCL_NonESM05547 [Trypanosoma cruzi]|eukprot:XP_818265.1 hypothetical protein [Trypanosoma cruzi strain CL Brener]
MSEWNAVVPLIVSGASDAHEVTHAELCAMVRGMEETVENTKRRLKQVDKIIERQRVVVNDVRISTSRFEDMFTKTNSDLQYIQQQLEYVVVSLEKERGIVADHTEQLRLFAMESNRRDGRSADVLDDGTSLLFWLATWLYRPLVHFAKGCYTLFSPLINTLQSLSLFNTDVLMRRSEIGVRLRHVETNEDLLKRLQKGSLDPTSLPKKK